MKTNTKRIIFFAYIAIFFVAAVVMAWFQPLTDCPGLLNPPDEHSRIKVVYYICNHLKLPTGFEEEIRIPSYGFSYGLYNVFPYIIQGFVMRFAKMLGVYGRGLIFAARFVNVLLGTVMCFVVWKIGALLFEKDLHAIMFSFAVMYLPESMFLHTYVNTDSAAMLSTAIIIYALLAAYKEDFNIMNSIILSLGISLCALSYYNAYGAILAAIIVFFLFYIKKNEDKYYYDYKNMLKFGFFIAGLVILMSAWWFIRAYFVLDGDFLGLQTRYLLQEQYGVVLPPTLKAQGKSLMDLFRMPKYFKFEIDSFIMTFGSMSVFAADILYYLYIGLFCVGFAAFIFFFFYNKEIKKANIRKVSLYFGLFLILIIPFILSVRYSYTIEYQPQGRYLLPSLIAFMIFMIKGGISLLDFLKAKFSKISVFFDRVCPALIIAFFAVCLVCSVMWATKLYLTVYPDFM